MKMFKAKETRYKWMAKLFNAIEAWIFPCEHTHTFVHLLPNITPWYYKGKKKGIHSGIVIEGCYLCGKIRARDYQA